MTSNWKFIKDECKARESGVFHRDLVLKKRMVKFEIMQWRSLQTFDTTLCNCLKMHYMRTLAGLGGV